MFGVNPRFVGPDVPGYVFAGNSSDAKDEADAIQKYATLYGLDTDQVIALRVNYEGWNTWATYVAAQHKPLVDLKSAELALRIEMLRDVFGDM